MPLNLQRFVEQVAVTEGLSVRVLAVMEEPVRVRESLLQTIRHAIYYALSGRVPRRLGGLFPGRRGT